jgi:hypothetical protein
MDEGKPKAHQRDLVQQADFYQLERAFADKFKYGMVNTWDETYKHFEMRLRFFCSHVNTIPKAYERKFHTT